MFKNGDDAHKNKNNSIPSSMLDLGIAHKQTTREKSNIIPQSLKEPQPSGLAEAKVNILDI